MGSHHVGKAFVIAVELIMEDRISAMSQEELLSMLDVVGNKYRGIDAEFDGLHRPPHLLGETLIKCFYPNLIPMPQLDSSNEEWDLWDEEWNEKVYQPFRNRYDFC